MTAKMYYDNDADPAALNGQTVAIIGYGSQGHAHAQNLKSSGVKVVVGLRKDSPSWAKAEGAGLAGERAEKPPRQGELRLAAGRRLAQGDIGEPGFAAADCAGAVIHHAQHDAEGQKNLNEQRQQNGWYRHEENPTVNGGGR